jgi:glycine cleavage system H protein
VKQLRRGYASDFPYFAFVPRRQQKEVGISELCFPDDILYHTKHTWIKMLDHTSALVGISDFAQEQLGEVAYVDLPSVEAQFSTDDAFGAVESIKAISNIYMPVNGTVIAVNNVLSSKPYLVNASPYGEGWMLKIVLAVKASKDHLKSSADYISQIHSA